MERLYADHAATTPLCDEARRAMEPWLIGGLGNPSSLHAEGRAAKGALDEARAVLADALRCEFGEVVFTSGGTESANLAVVGAALANPDPRRTRILFSAAEHHAVLHTAPILERLGYRVEWVQTDRWSRPDLNHLSDLLGDDVLVVSAMHANNETGALTPDLSRLASLVAGAGALWHCDAVQTFGHLPLDEAIHADLISVSAHKLYGPKGAGALRIKAGTRVAPLIRGGGQEREMRGGTENVAGIVGFAAALGAPRGGERGIADAFRREAARAVPDLVWTLPDDVERLPGHAHFRIPGVSAESLLIVLDRLGVSASAGAACSSGAIEPSHVLLACGWSEEQAGEGVRFSFGSSNSERDASEAASRLAEAVATIRRARRSRSSAFPSD
ncbi:MAG: cysteine desulfurase [Fimbriimonadaceae bacterium]|nr:cysteine desulfurase [Fimbriimonadaceae bacterium]